MLAEGFGAAAKVPALPLSIAFYPKWAKLFLLHGASLDDPDDLLEGKGPRVRSVRLSGLAMLKSDPVDRLIAAAVLQAGWKLDPKAKD